MSGARRVYKLGPVGYTVSTAVTGGMLVMFDSANHGEIKPAAAGATKYNCVGVACADANPAGSDPAGTIGGWARPEVAVAYGPEDVELLFASACVPGDAVKCAANGAVTKATVGTDAESLIVGKVTAEADVASGAWGRVKLLV